MAINLNTDDLTISIVEKGESNTGYNVGGGAEIFKDKNGVVMNFRSLSGGTNITVSQTGDLITVNNDLDWSSINGDVLPDATDIRSFGSPTKKWENAYFTGMDILDVGTETQMLASQPLRIQSPNQQLIVDSGAADIVLDTDPSNKVWVPNHLHTGGDVLIGGNLTVNGTTTTVNSTEVTVDDINITLADGATTPAEANGGGITIAGANAVLAYDSTGDQMTWNKKLFAPELGANTVTGNDAYFVNINASGDTNLGDASTDTITMTGSVDSNIVPDNNTRELGTTTNRWGGVWTDSAIVTNTTFTNTLDVNGSGVQSNLIPTAGNTYDLGSLANRWENVFANYAHANNTTTTSLDVQSNVVSNLNPSVGNTYTLGNYANRWSIVAGDEVSANRVETDQVNINNGGGLYVDGGATINSNLFVNGSTILGNGAEDSHAIYGAATFWNGATVHTGLTSTGPVDVQNTFQTSGNTTLQAAYNGNYNDALILRNTGALAGAVKLGVAQSSGAGFAGFISWATNNGYRLQDIKATNDGADSGNHRLEYWMYAGNSQPVEMIASNPSVGKGATNFDFYATSHNFKNGQVNVEQQLRVANDIVSDNQINIKPSGSSDAFVQISNNEVKTTSNYGGSVTLQTDGSNLSAGNPAFFINSTGGNNNGLSAALDGEYYITSMNHKPLDSFNVDHGVTMWAHNYLNMTHARDRSYMGKPLRLASIPVGTTAPNPGAETEGEFWLDTTGGTGNFQMKTWRDFGSGYAWQNVQSMDAGDMFWDSTTGQVVVCQGGGTYASLSMNLL